MKLMGAADPNLQSGLRRCGRRSKSDSREERLRHEARCKDMPLHEGRFHAHRTSLERLERIKPLPIEGDSYLTRGDVKRLRDKFARALAYPSAERLGHSLLRTPEPDER